MTAKKRNPVPGVVVYKRGNKWAYRVELERDPLTNARQWEYQSGFATEHEAWTAGVKAKSDHKHGRRVAPNKRTLADFLTEWMAAIQDSIKPSTYMNYSDYQEAYVLPIIGKKPLQEVDVPLLNALYRHLLTAGRCKPDSNTLMYEYWESRTRAGHDPKPKEIVAHCGVSIYAAQRAVARYRAGRLPVPKSQGLAPKTVKNVHRMLHRALADAVAWRYLEYNPAEHACLPRESRNGTRNRGTTWTPEDLAAWLAVAVQDRDAGIWVLAATTGMRRSELAGAELDLLDLNAAVLEIGDTRVVVGGKAEESDGKTDSARRTISLDTLTVDYLRRHLAMLDAEKEAFGGSYRDSGRLMRNLDGTTIHPDTITRRFNRLVDKAGVRRIRLHDVRHTYATMSQGRGVASMQHSAKSARTPDLRCGYRDVHGERAGSAGNAAVTCDVITRLHQPEDCCSHFCYIQ